MCSQSLVRSWSTLRVLCLAIGSLFLRGEAATFIVTRTEDSGPGSLRQAILAANATPGRDVIEFNIPGVGIPTLAPLTDLPASTGPIFVNGWSQPGSRPNTLSEGSDAIPGIRLDGSFVSNGIFSGLTLRASNSEVRGLCIVNFDRGIDIQGGQNTIIAGNWIGLDLDNLPSPNTFEGINVTADFQQTTTRHRIGGTAPADRNVISCNGTGIQLFPGTAAENAIVGNYIGTDITGTLPRGNTFHGIMIQSPRNIIGGPNRAGRNVISANQDGIVVLGAADNRIYCNYIGTDVSGTLDLGNSDLGIMLQGCLRTIVGTEAPETGSLVSNNHRHGIQLLGSDDTVIVGNIIGSSPSLDRALGNLENGLLIDGSRNRIGGTNVGEANIILNSGKASVMISSGTNNIVRGNTMSHHRGLGVDLGFDGRLENDSADNDVGANQFQNHPTLDAATATAAGLRIVGTLHSTPLSHFRVDFYGGRSAGFSGFAQADVFLGTTEIQTSGNGLGAFDAVISSPLPPGTWACALAVDAAGNTSELSDPVSVTGVAPLVRLSWVQTVDTLFLRWPAAALGFTLERTGSLGTDAGWLPVREGITTAGGNRFYPVPFDPAAHPIFFRLRSDN